MTLDTPTGVKEFCSEVCFTQCRRASFKKSKICDWCKHVRHTVNYVEFTDGETQLQFCSEKCLNQYKMSVFCKETQELSGKVAKSDSASDGDCDSHREKILITPELWLGGDHARRAAEARFSARERERAEREMKNDRIYIASDQSLDLSTKSSSSRKDSNGDHGKTYSIDKVKQEPGTSSRTKRNHSLKDMERGSPHRPEVKSTPPTTSVPGLPPHMVHPMMASLSPWLQHPHLLSALPPGLMPYGPLHPMMFAGMAPPQAGSSSQGSPNSENDDKGHEKPHVSRKDMNANHAKLSPRSDSTNVSQSISPRREQRQSPASVDRRTSSLFPMDFPHFFPGGHLPPPQQIQPHFPVPRPPPQLPGVPPVTMMIPFPVLLPVPVPIPIPVPFTVKQLATLFGHKLENSETSTTTSSLKPEANKERQSPLPTYLHSPHSVRSSSSDASNTERYQVRAGSRNSLPDMSFVRQTSRATRSESRSMKRSLTPEMLDLSRSSKFARREYARYISDEDGAIDLSASRENGHTSDDSYSLQSAINGTVRDKTSPALENDDDLVDKNGQSLPKIHIITHKDETPLNAPLPLPPTDNSYSSRRGLILDAPAVPKKVRSPSPERRVYVRNVPRDIVEAARRRCNIRARIRTK